MQLIASSKEVYEGLPKKVVIDIPESSSKASEEIMATEVTTPAAETSQPESVVDAEITAGSDKDLFVILDLQSTDLDVPDDMVMDNILANLTRISSSSLKSILNKISLLQTLKISKARP